MSMGKGKNPKLHKIFNILFFTAALVSLLVSGLLVMKERDLSGSLPSQQAAARFGTGGRKYAETGIYFEKSAGPSEADITAYRSGINRRLYDDGYMDRENSNPVSTSTDARLATAGDPSYQAGGRAWADGYAGFQETALRRGDQVLTVNGIFTGGDFFLFHPVKLLCGNYPLRGDEILLDEKAAWQLFGSTDVAGLTVWMGNRILNVTGVSASPEGKAAEYAYGKRAAAYIPYAGAVLSGICPPVTVYETVLPDPVRGYGSGVTRQVVLGEDTVAGEDTEDSQTGDAVAEAVEISDRFSAGALFGTSPLGKYPEMQKNGIIYPFWENAARHAVTEARRLVRWAVGLLILPGVALVVLIRRGIRSGALKIRELLRRRTPRGQRKS